MLIVVGASHQSAALADRETLARSADGLRAACAQMRGRGELAGWALLATCNRMELYADSGDGDPAASARALAAHWRAAAAMELPLREDGRGQMPFAYWQMGAGMVRHLMRVASGLESLVLGELQIAGQVRATCREARRADSLSPPLGHAFDSAMGAARRVRAQTDISSRPVSLAYAAVQLARRLFSEMGDKTAMLVGPGDTMELVGRHLMRQGVGRLLVAGRNRARCRSLLGRIGAAGEALSLKDMGAHLARVDLLFSATASARPVLGADAVAAALRTRRRRPMFMADMAVPRDLDPAIAQLDDAYLCSIDDLGGVLDENRYLRGRALPRADAIIDNEVRRWQQDTRERGVASAIADFRHDAMQMRDAAVAEALRNLQKGGDAEQCLQQLAHRLTSKLLHRPTAALRRTAAADGASAAAFAAHLRRKS